MRWLREYLGQLINGSCGAKALNALGLHYPMSTIWTSAHYIATALVTRSAPVSHLAMALSLEQSETQPLELLVGKLTEGKIVLRMSHR